MFLDKLKKNLNNDKFSVFCPKPGVADNGEPTTVYSKEQELSIPEMQEMERFHEQEEINHKNKKVYY